MIPSRSTLGVLVTLVASLSIAGPAAADTPSPTISSVAVNGSNLDTTDNATFYTNDTAQAAMVTVTGDPSASGIDYFDGAGQSQVPDTNGVATFAASAPGSFDASAQQTVNGVTSAQTFLQVQADVVPFLQGVSDGDTYTAGNDLGVYGAIPGDDVELYVDGSKVADANADSTGSVQAFALTSPLSTGHHSASVKSVDGQGIESDGSTPVGFYVAPDSPTIQSPTTTGDSSYLNTQPSIIVSGVNAGATVDLYALNDQGDTGPSLASATSVSGGTVTLTPSATVADGFYHYVVTQTLDEGGTPITSDWMSAPTAQTDVNVVTAAPQLGSALGDNPYTNDNQPRFDVYVPGVGGDDALAKVRLVDALTGHTLAEVGQYDSWVPTTPLADGSYSVYAVAIDDLGHVGTARSTAVNFTVDTVAPSTPSFTSPTDGSTVATRAPSITVHGEAGSDMCLALDISPDAQEGDATCVTADANGNATITPDTILSDGPHSLSVSSSDRAGNGSFASATITVAIATIPTPTPPPVQTPIKTPAPALTSVKLSSHTVSAGHPIKVRFLVNTPGTVTLTLTKKVKTAVKIKSHGKTKTVNRTVTKVVGIVHVKIAKAGQGSYTLTTMFAGHKLGRGSYSLSLKTTSGTSKSKPVTQPLNVR